MIQILFKKITTLSAAFLFIPVIIFFFGFLKLPLALFCCAVLLWCFFYLYKNEAETGAPEVRFSLPYYAAVAGILLLWLFFSGIGRFSFQNYDWIVRNAVLRDLVSYDWPVIFDFTGLDAEIAEAIGPTTSAGFVYYFTYWLPAALVGKLVGGENIFLFLWTFIALMLIVVLLNRYCGHNTWWTPFLLIGFSGLDLIGYAFATGGENFFAVSHMEWWASIMQYSANTTQLYWVFNQSVPCWLITALLLNLKKPSSILFVSCTILCYAPFCTFGMVPIAVFLILRGLRKTTDRSLWLRRICISPETLWMLLILLVFGHFYLARDGVMLHGFLYTLSGLSLGRFILIYFLFFLLEVGIYFIYLLPKYKNNGLYWVILAELALIPLYKMTGANDFCMRGSIAPLFVLMIFLLHSFSQQKIRQISVAILICVCLAFSTPAHEMIRSINGTMNKDRASYLRDDTIYSIGSPITPNGASLCARQFYALDYQKDFFFQYLAR